MQKVSRGSHLICDFKNVQTHALLDDKRFLGAIIYAAEKAGANVITSARYRLGHDSPAGFTVFVQLDESHISAHSYADLGLLALDIFCCGSTSVQEVLKYIINEIPELEVSIYTTNLIPRFIS